MGIAFLPPGEIAAWTACLSAPAPRGAPADGSRPTAARAPSASRPPSSGRPGSQTGDAREHGFHLEPFVSDVRL